jgi:O-antigen/teichoic acid export membrane protein
MYHLKSKLLEWSYSLSNLRKSAILNRFTKVFCVDAFVKASSFLLLPLFLKLMSQEEYAIYCYILSIISVVALVFNFGLYAAQSKIYSDSKESNKAGAIFTINIVLIFILAISMFILYSSGADYFLIKKLLSKEIDYEKYRLLIPIGVIISIYTIMLFNFFMVTEQIKKAQIHNILRVLMGTILTVAALYVIPGDKSFIRMEALFFSECLLLIIFLIFYVKAMKIWFDKSIALNASKIGFPIMISAVFGILINFSDKFFLARYAAWDDQSVYYLSISYAGIITAVYGSFQSIWLPMFLREKDDIKNFLKTKKVIAKSIIFLGILGLLIWILVFSLLYLSIINNKYNNVLIILPIMIISNILISLTGILSNYTIYWNATHIAALFSFILACISIPLNLFSAKYYGIFGVSVASVILNLIFLLLYFKFIKNRMSFL